MKKFLLFFLPLSVCVIGLSAQTDSTVVRPAGTDSTQTAPVPPPPAQPAATTPPPAAQPAPATPPPAKSSRSFKEKYSFNVSSSFWANSTSTYFEFSPVVFYHFPRTFAVGTGPTYIYRRDRVHDVNLNGWGWKAIGQAWFTKWLYGWTEYQVIENQYLKLDETNNKKFTRDHQTVDSWFLSLGIALRTGKRSGVNMQALYDVLYDKETSPYYSAWTYRVSFGF